MGVGLGGGGGGGQEIQVDHRLERYRDGLAFIQSPLCGPQPNVVKTTKVHGLCWQCLTALPFSKAIAVR